MSAIVSVSAFSDSYSILSVSREMSISLPMIVPQIVNIASLMTSSGPLCMVNERELGDKRLCDRIKLSNLQTALSMFIQNPVDLIPSIATDIFLTDIDILYMTFDGRRNYRLDRL